VSAVVATPEAVRPLNKDPFLHTSTYAGAPLAMAAAAATIAAIEAEDVVGRAARLGELLARALIDITAPHMGGLVTEVRAEGLLIGIQFAEAHYAAEFLYELIDHRVLACHSLNAQSTVRLTPPVCLSETDVEWLTSSFRSGLAEVAGRYQT
jgi:putrescine aminotransferase